MEKPINIRNKFQFVDGLWNPAVIAELNGQYVKIAKIKGEFVMHHHDHEDEMFLVIKGSFAMEYTDRTEILNEGDMIVVPKGIDHRPIANEEAWIMLFEPATTLNTGNMENELTRKNLDHL